MENILARGAGGPELAPYDSREVDDDDDDECDNFYGAITQHMPLKGRLDKDHEVD